MRVLLCHQPIDGGVGRHICDLAGGLAEAGHQVTLCSPAPPSGVTGDVAHVQLDLRRAAAPRADLAALARLAAIQRELRPQVVHAHSSKAGAITRLARFADPRVPVLYSPHGYAFAGHFTRSGERAAYRWIERALSPLATRVVCVCEAEARLARAVGADGRVVADGGGAEDERRLRVGHDPAHRGLDLPADAPDGGAGLAIAKSDGGVVVIVPGDGKLHSQGHEGRAI